jgi:phosphatidylglycerophosphatase A
MAHIKESSDEFNPAVVNGHSVERRPARSAKDYLALIIATCGVGYFPIAPGTWGSLVGVGIYLAVRWRVLSWIQLTSPGSFLRFNPLPILVAVELLLITVITLAGFWAASRAEKLLGRKDPGKVVIDEVAGQLIALLPVMRGTTSGWWGIGLSFLLFRFFDIVKPYPARRLEKLESGLGIMSDDLVAGAYAAVGTSVIIAIVSWVLLS